MVRELGTRLIALGFNAWSCLAPTVVWLPQINCSPTSPEEVSG